MKYLTRSEAETKRRQAIGFLRRIGNDNAADDFQAMDAAEYAEHRGAQLLQNPTRSAYHMPRQTGPTKVELADRLEEITDLAEEALDPELTREDLVVKIKELADVASGETEEEEEAGDEEEREDEDEGEEEEGGGDGAE